MASAPARPLRLLSARLAAFGQLGTPRARPSHWDPSHRLGGSSEPPPTSPISLRVSVCPSRPGAGQPVWAGLRAIVGAAARSKCRPQPGQCLTSAPAPPQARLRLVAPCSPALPGWSRPRPCTGIQPHGPRLLPLAASKVNDVIAFGHASRRWLALSRRWRYSSPS